MAKAEDKYLQVAKEIAVKFIEVGRISPAGFGDVFNEIYRGVKDAVENNPPARRRPPDNAE
ncbi:MAG: hypothetical protein JRI97_06955 [Deltaproteobacteria bacterium]|nr:hypothetical protein [Deltaproteobacteria bacterium]